LNIRKEIKIRLDEIQIMMERQEHLSNPKLVMEKIECATKFWSIFSEEEREFISIVRLAFQTKTHWLAC